MSKPSLTHLHMIKAFDLLDKRIDQGLTLLIGGGGAMVLGHDFPLSTMDIDAIPKGMTMEELSPLIEEIGHELNIPLDWLNPYFSTFTFVLNNQYESRLVTVYQGENITATALGKEDLLLMKCFAGRDKDIPHTLALIKSGADLEEVEHQLDILEQKNTPGVAQAIAFLDDVLEQI